MLLFNNSNGFDGVYIKYDANGNVDEILINEAKQVGSTGNIKLNPRNDNSGLSAQMSYDWRDNVLDRMYAEGGEMRTLSNLISANKSKITKTVTAVDRSTEEIIILKLDNY